MALFNKKKYNVDERVEGLHLKLGKVTQNKTTTSVAISKENVGIVGSSEGKLRKSISKELYDFEIEAKGEPGKHAEVYVMEEADKKDLTITNIAASRPVCIECEEIIKKKDIKTNTPFSGKKSKKRR